MKNNKKQAENDKGAECNCICFDHSADFTHDDRKAISVSDKKSATKYMLDNNSRLHHSLYRVDGALITDGNKCDYLLINCENKRAYFIEIKGSDLNHAIDQIDAALTTLRKSIPNHTVYARIALTRVNGSDLKSIKYKKLQKWVQGMGGNIIQRTNVLTETV